MRKIVTLGILLVAILDLVLVVHGLAPQTSVTVLRSSGSASDMGFSHILKALGKVSL
jgi:hypothetical protein